MSWFEYGKPKRRHLRNGVQLRTISLPEDILSQAKKIIKKGERIMYVIVKEIRENNYVWLEFACTESTSKESYPNRHIVFGIHVKENTKWICEGDLGRGYKE